MANDKLDQAKQAMERDFEQTKADLPGVEGRDLNQEATDTVRQAAGKQPVPPKDQPNR